MARFPTTSPHVHHRAGDIALPNGQRGADHMRLFSQARTVFDPRNPDLCRNIAVYRGDTRAPNDIFANGFSKLTWTTIQKKTNYRTGQITSVAEDNEISISGEKVLNGVSTSTDLSTVRRKYGGNGVYIYGIFLSQGIDFSDVNDLYEVNTFAIPATEIVVCAGPVVHSVSDIEGRFGGFSMVGGIHVNPNHTVATDLAGPIIAQMRDAFSVRPTFGRTAQGAAEI